MERKESIFEIGDMACFQELEEKQTYIVFAIAFIKPDGAENLPESWHIKLINENLHETGWLPETIFRNLTW